MHFSFIVGAKSGSTPQISASHLKVPLVGRMYRSCNLATSQFCQSVRIVKDLSKCHMRRAILDPFASPQRWLIYSTRLLVYEAASRITNGQHLLDRWFTQCALVTRNAMVPWRAGDHRCTDMDTLCMSSGGLGFLCAYAFTVYPMAE